MATQVKNGKAFEYACVLAVAELSGNVVVNMDAPYLNAKREFDALTTEEKTNDLKAARTALKIIKGLEPQIQHGKDTLFISVASDAMGIAGDVRDVILLRKGVWNCGLSCKHNHEAVKHYRVTTDPDFSYNWIKIHCSKEFKDAMKPVYERLEAHIGSKWPDKQEKDISYYGPVLNAYRDEIERLATVYENVPALLLKSFFGTHDFYKIIMSENAKTTTVEGFNVYGTLNRRCAGIVPVNVPKLKMPTRLIEASRPKWNTIELVFDEGWAVEMRLHNKDSKIRTSALAWNIALIGVPPYFFVNTRPWEE